VPPFRIHEVDTLAILEPVTACIGACWVHQSRSF
jgi:hypothetical protein